jgi:hypothetical protein
MSVYRFTAKPVWNNKEPSPGIIREVEIVWDGTAKQAFEVLRAKYNMAWSYTMTQFPSGSILRLSEIKAEGMPQPNSEDAPMAGSETEDFFGAGLMR